MLDPKHILLVRDRNINIDYLNEYSFVFTSIFGHSFYLTSYGVPFIYDKHYYDEYVSKNYEAKV